MNYFESYMQTLMSNLPSLLGALIILIVGWIIAKFISTKIGKLISKNNKINTKLTKLLGSEVKEAEASKFIVKLTFYILMIFVLTAVFEALGYSMLIEPLNKFLGSIFIFVPKLIGALILIVIAWLVAKIISTILVKTLEKIKFDDKVQVDSKSDISFSKALGDILFWFIILIFLPGILSILSLGGILDPVQNLITKTLDAFPNIFAALIIALFGWFIAKKVKEVSTQIFASLGVDKFLGNDNEDTMPLSLILGTIIYILILIPVLSSALDMIGLTVVTIPAMNMINSILVFLPKIFAALVIVYLAYFIGNILGDIVGGIVSKIKLEKIISNIGFSDSTTKDFNISKPTKKFVKIAIIFFALLEATNIIGLTQLSLILDQFILLIGKIILGLVVIAIGLYLAQVLGKLINKKESSYTGFLSIVTKSSIIFLSLAMGLRQMGIANEIINMAFGFTIGAVAVASAIAFGIGGKEMAAKLLSKFENK